MMSVKCSLCDLLKVGFSFNQRQRLKSMMSMSVASLIHKKPLAYEVITVCINPGGLWNAHRYNLNFKKTAATGPAGLES